MTRNIVLHFQLQCRITYYCVLRIICLFGEGPCLIDVICVFVLRIEVSNASFEHRNNMANILICLVVCVLSCFNVLFIFVLCQCLWILRSWLSLRFSLTCIQEKYGDTKCLFRSCKSTKNNQHNNQTKDKRTNNYLHWHGLLDIFFIDIYSF